MKQNVMKSTEEKVEAFVANRQLLERGASVILGVSGGADSVCLLFLLCSLREKWNLTLKAVHVNHGIRKEAGRDEAFTTALCERLGVECEVVRASVPDLAKEWKCSEEEAGRVVRYEAFERIRREMETSLPSESEGKKESNLSPEFSGVIMGKRSPNPRVEPVESPSNRAVIAVAHHGDDNAETVLFHLFRGTGLKGLTGIRPKRDNIIRPLLCLSKEEIRTYLEAGGETWVEDATNGEDTYARNRIRHQILPKAEEICPGAGLHINRCACQLAEIEDYLAESVKAFRLGVCDGYDIDVTSFLKGHIALQKGLLLQLLTELSPGRRDMGSVQVEQLLELAHREGNRTLELPFGVLAERSYDRIFLRVPGDEQDYEHYAYSPHGADIADVEETPEERYLLGNCTIHMEILESTPNWTEKVYSKWLDYDKMGKPSKVTLRSREQGDYLYVAGPGGKPVRKTLKDYMINEKIPAKIRDRIPVLADGHRVLWLVGYRIGEDCKITDETKTIAYLKITK